MNIKLAVERTCIGCVLAIAAALTVLALTWVVILVNYAGPLDTLKIMFPS